MDYDAPVQVLILLQGLGWFCIHDVPLFDVSIFTRQSFYRQSSIYLFIYNFDFEPLLVRNWENLVIFMKI